MTYKMEHEHGTMLAYWDGCRCDNCKWVALFSLLIDNDDAMEIKPNSVYIEPQPQGSRQFPARNLIMFMREPNSSLLAEKLGTSRKIVTGWLRRGACFTVWEADHYAIKAGTHPVIVWGQKFYDGVDDELA